MKKVLLLTLALSVSKIAFAFDLNVVIKDPSGKPIPNVAVLITTAKSSLEKRTEKLTISQKDKAFSPYFTIMQTGQPIEFSNSDDITHHIFSASRANNFSFQIRQGEINSSIIFETPTSISMGCNIHDWMTGHILVTATPYFALTDEYGKATVSLKNSGAARIEIWHPQMRKADKLMRKSIVLTNEPMNLDITLKEELEEIPDQTSGDDFDFLDDY